MTFQNTVVALLAILVFAATTHELRSGHPAPHSSQQEVADVRIVRIAKPMLSESLSRPSDLAKVLGLQSWNSLEVRRFISTLNREDTNQAVLTLRRSDGNNHLASHAVRHIVVLVE